jgi:serine/threonine-protein kinase RsbW
MVTTHRHRELSLDIAPRFTSLADLRRHLRGWLAEGDVEANVVDDLLLVATELCSNAIEASVGEDLVGIEVTIDGTTIALSVSNAAQPTSTAASPPVEPDCLRERGRGLAIVRALVDTVEMASVDGRTVVRTTRGR